MSGARAFMIPQWTEDLGQLMAAGAKVEFRCSGCQTGHPVALGALKTRFGPLYSLWNRRPPCPRCGEPGWYRAQPKGGAWQKILHDAPPDLVEPLHQRWRASLPDDVRGRLPVLPMMAATSQCVVAACGPCDWRFYLSASMVGSWGGGITLDGLTGRLALQCGRQDCAICTDLARRGDVPADEWPP